MKKFLKLGIAALATAALSTGVAQATDLKIHTHFSNETLSGKMAAEFVEDVQKMSNGEIKIDLLFGGTLVKSQEIFDAAVDGVVDCDMSGGAYQTSKDPAWQFTGDLLGGYTNPYQQLAWLLHNDGYTTINALHNEYDMEFVGWWIPGPESLTSTRPIRGVADFKDWKFRSPPGMATLVFKNLGASPIVMDFNEIFTALETGIIDGADAANLTNNVGLGLYDIGEHTNFPGFHSMPADHLSCNKDVWDAMPAHHQHIMKIAMQALALRNATINEVSNARTAKELRAKGINLYEWSEEELGKYRNAVKAGWTEFATTEASKALLKSHVDFLVDLGAMSAD